MPDLNTVIQAFENCTAPVKCRDCPWVQCEADHKTVEMPLDLAQAALSMLKAKEAEFVSIRDSDGGKTHWYVCGACKAPINPGEKYCHECGRAVKWG